jgi:hypothetical protein
MCAILDMEKGEHAFRLADETENVGSVPTLFYSFAVPFFHKRRPTVNRSGSVMRPATTE